MDNTPDVDVWYPTDWTVVISGPLAQRGPLLVSLQQAACDLDEPADDPAHGLPNDDPTVGWVTARTDNIPMVLEHAARAGWQQRIHWPTPRCGVCAGNGTTTTGRCGHCAGTGRTNKTAPSPEQQLREELDEMRARLARLETVGGASL